MWSWKDGCWRDCAVSMARTAGWGMKRGMKPSDSIADPGTPAASPIQVDRLDESLGELAKPVPEPHLVEGVDAAGLQPIAAEGALEAGVALQQRDLHPAAGKQVRECCSSGARPDDDDTSDRHRTSPLQPWDVNSRAFAAEPYMSDFPCDYRARVAASISMPMTT